MTNLTKYQQNQISKTNQLSHEQIEVLKRTVCNGATNEEFQLFLWQCTRTGLDPFAKQIHSIKIGNSRITQIGIDGFRVLSERSGKYGGMLPYQWCGEDGQWVDVWLKKYPPMAAKATIIRKDFENPIVAVALLAECDKKNYIWNDRPVSMLAIRAESIARRIAFPQELSGLYTDAELDTTTSETSNQNTFSQREKPAAKTPISIETWENYYIPFDWLPEEFKGQKITYKEARTNPELYFINAKGQKNTFRQYMAYAWSDDPQKKSIYLQLKERYPSKPHKKENIQEIDPKEAEEIARQAKKEEEDYLKNQKNT